MQLILTHFKWTLVKFIHLLIYLMKSISSTLTLLIMSKCYILPFIKFLWALWFFPPKLLSFPLTSMIRRVLVLFTVFMKKNILAQMVLMPNYVLLVGTSLTNNSFQIFITSSRLKSCQISSNIASSPLYTKLTILILFQIINLYPYVIPPIRLLLKFWLTRSQVTSLTTFTLTNQYSLKIGISLIILFLPESFAMISLLIIFQILFIPKLDLRKAFI